MKQFYALWLGTLICGLAACTSNVQEHTDDRDDRVHVLVQSDGRPLAGVRVVVIRWMDWLENVGIRTVPHFDSTLTGNDGSFLLDTLPSGAFVLQADGVQSLLHWVEDGAEVPDTLRAAERVSFTVTSESEGNAVGRWWIAGSSLSVAEGGTLSLPPGEYLLAAQPAMGTLVLPVQRVLIVADTAMAFHVDTAGAVLMSSQAASYGQGPIYPFGNWSWTATEDSIAHALHQSALWHATVDSVGGSDARLYGAVGELDFQQLDAGVFCGLDTLFVRASGSGSLRVVWLDSQNDSLAAAHLPLSSSVFRQFLLVGDSARLAEGTGYPADSLWCAAAVTLQLQLSRGGSLDLLEISESGIPANRLRQ